MLKGMAGSANRTIGGVDVDQDELPNWSTSTNTRTRSRIDELSH
ncbi:hypothetical protein [Micromonospora sp. NPDC002575]